MVHTHPLSPMSQKAHFSFSNLLVLSASAVRHLNGHRGSAYPITGSAYPNHMDSTYPNHMGSSYRGSAYPNHGCAYHNHSLRGSVYPNHGFCVP